MLAGLLLNSHIPAAVSSLGLFTVVSIQRNYHIAGERNMLIRGGRIYAVAGERDYSVGGERHFIVEDQP